MDESRTRIPSKAKPGFLSRLLRDRAGNTLVLIAASIAPLLALIGGGIDMSRAYLSQARLQQACDAGVLAARKALGAGVAADGQVPDEAVEVGDRFFNINFRDGAYGSEDRSFQMALEDDYAVSGKAAVKVPTTIMAIFGNKQVDIKVNCQAQLNFSNSDVMFVLDTTGSMNGKNPGDSKSRIEALRDTVKSFHKQLEGSKAPGIRIRYGFVPYSVNVNVGHLLEDDWVVNEWTYQSRERVVKEGSSSTSTYTANWTTISGTYSQKITSTYAAKWVSTGGGGEWGGGGGYYSCDKGLPSDSRSTKDQLISETTEYYAGPPEGEKITQHWKRTTDGKQYWASVSGSTCQVWERTYNNYVQEFDKITIPVGVETWLYKPILKDVSNWRSETAGCMEERSTYEIYTKDEEVDLDRALDLNLDRIPDPGDPDTQWRPMYPDIVWARALKNENASSWSVAEQEYDGNYFKPASRPDLVTCPAKAQKLKEMDASEIAAYVDSLTPQGYTYHDIGMIWGGRLISPTGLFADENADIDGKPTTRHLIFLTDGETNAKDAAYGAYGMEMLDFRRWTHRPDPLLGRTVELRFYHACQEVKKHNVTVWVIGFGTKMNDVMMECAGDGHWFTADNAAQLEETFAKIAKSMAELRISE